MSQGNTLQEKNVYSRALGVIITGCTIAVLGLAALLTINGQSAVPKFAQIMTMALIALGIVLPATGLFWLKKAIGKTQAKIGNGFAFQGYGLIALLIGVTSAMLVSSLTSFLVAASFLSVACVLSFFAVVLVRKNKDAIGANHRAVICLVMGITLILSGIGLIIASNLSSFYYFISQVENSILTDVGATLSAYGSIFLAYSFFNFKRQWSIESFRA